MVNNSNIPNAETREEFLVILEYLLKYSYNKKTSATQSKIMQYAIDNYPSLNFRRNRIGDILEHLSQIFDKYPDKFPFKLEYELTKTGQKRFYISEKLFSKKELIDLIVALNNNSEISSNKVKHLTNKLLALSSNEEKTKSILNIVKRHDKVTSKSTTYSSSIVDIINEAINEYKLLNIKFNDWDSVNHSGSFHKFKEIKDKNDQMMVYVYKSIIVKDVTNIIVYSNYYKMVFITPINNISIYGKPIAKIEDGFVDFEIDDKNSSNIDEWLEKFFSGQTGFLIDFTFKFTTNDKKTTNKIKESYKKWWKKPLVVSETKQRNAEIKYIDIDGKNKIKTVVANDAYVTLKANYSSFLKWYIGEKMFVDIVLIEPKGMFDKNIAIIGERLLNRVNKYGNTFKYSIEKVATNEYKKRLNEEREFLKKYLQNKSSSK